MTSEQPSSAMTSTPPQPSSYDLISPLATGSSPESPTSEPADSQVCVFLADQNGVNMQFPVAPSRITCETILHKLNQGLHPNDSSGEQSGAERLFCLWMDSPLLELQLKADHRPFHLLRRWDVLLAQFVASAQSIKHLQQDSPALSYRRDVFAGVALERSVHSALCDKLLLDEAMDNVRRGRYPLDDETAISLAALALRATLPHIEQPSQGQLSPFLPNVLPSRMWNATSAALTFGRQRSKLAQKVLEKYVQLPSKEQMTPIDARNQVLEQLRSLPAYGSAFFEAQVERPVSTFAALISHPDLKVWIAINTVGLHLISRKTPVSPSMLSFRSITL
jgi:hypothetical protein